MKATAPMCDECGNRHHDTPKRHTGHDGPRPGDDVDHEVVRQEARRQRNREELERVDLDVILDDALLASRPWMRLEAERLAREGAVVYLNPTLQEDADHNMFDSTGRNM